MTAIPDLFAHVAMALEDLHAIAVEGQQADNARDIQNVLMLHLRSGLVVLDGTVGAIATALDGGGR